MHLKIKIVADICDKIYNLLEERYLLSSAAHWTLKLSAQFTFQEVVNKFSGGSKGRGAPPMDQNFFNFIGFSENIIKILGRRPPQGLAPPPRRSSGSAYE